MKKQNARFAVSSRLRLSALLLLAGLIIGPLHAYEATLLCLSGNKCPDNIEGLWLSNLATGQVKRIRQNVSACSFSPDGKQIAYVSGGKLYIINNDGTNEEKMPDGQEWATDGWSGSDLRWTERGIFWIANDKLVRFIASTKKIETVVKLQDVGYICDQSMKTAGTSGTIKGGAFVMSTDGLRYWARYAQAPSTSNYSVSNWQKANGGGGGLSCATSNNRGVHYFAQFSPDYSTYDIVWDSQWGHGYFMTAGGSLMLVKFGAPHRDLAIYKPQQGSVVDTIYSWNNRWNPPYPAGYEARPLAACANNNAVYVGFAVCVPKTGLCTENNEHRHPLLVNWKTNTLLGEFKLPPGGEIEGCLGPSHAWDGPLPGATNEPFLGLDRTEMTFTTDGTAQPAAQKITVTNKGKGTLGALSCAVSPASAAWLSVSPDNSGGNTQTITNTIKVSSLPDGKSVATVTISGGGATNTVSYMVTAYSGNILPAPTGLTAEISGDSLLDVALSWTDNADNEAGFIIERKVGNESFAEIHRTAANASSYTDKARDYGTSCTYRIAAFAGSEKSDYSSEATAKIVGIQWLRITSPSENTEIAAGKPLTIAWECNLVTNVYIQVSYDEGLSWEVITQQGGILLENTRTQGEFAWTVPAGKDISGFKLAIVNYSDNELLAVFPTSNNSAKTVRSAFASGAPSMRIANSGRLIVQNVLPDELDITLFSVSGRQLARLHVEKESAAVVSSSGIGAGVYIAKIFNRRTGAVGVQNFTGN
jgi:hypothetical protein